MKIYFGYAPVKKSRTNFVFRSAIVIVTCFISMGGCVTAEWKQFHGGGENQGYTPVRSMERLVAKWAKPFHVGYISYSSPAIADDGTIYIGTSVGALAAIKNDGSAFKWVFHPAPTLLNPAIISSPAIGSKGDIYFILSRSVGKLCDLCVESFSSILMKVDPQNGQLEASFDFNEDPKEVGFSYTTVSPKLIIRNGDDFIFVPSKDHVFVLDKNCAVIAQSDLMCTADKGDKYDRLSMNAGAPGGPHYFDTYKDPGDFWLDPTPAVIEKVDGKDLPNPILVVATNRCGIQAFSWSPPPGSALTSLWYEQKDFDELFSSPAISTAGEVIVGSESGRLYSYGLQNGTENWHFDAEEPLLSSPSLYGGLLRVYIAGLHNVYAVENGNLIAKFPLPAHTESSCASTEDKIFVSFPLGLNSLSPDFSMIANDNTLVGGMSSPAIGKDGTIYMVSVNGSLMAYKAP